MVICKGCGADAGEGIPMPTRCGSCPPWTCETCGETNHLATGLSCPCWVSLEGMNLADLKGLFARDGLSIDRPTDPNGARP